jgi:hypothetical protein
MSNRLKLAMFSVASRFAAPGTSSTSLLSPAEYAKRAQGLRCTQSNTLCIQEIKASLLLCIHNIAESGHWDSVTEVGKLARMADIYHASHVDASHVGSDVRCDAEEWRSVWWTIYSLDTCCSAVA